MKRPAPLLLAFAVVAAGGCGDDGAMSEPATRLLERGFSTDVDTGVLSLEAEVEHTEPPSRSWRSRASRTWEARRPRR